MKRLAVVFLCFIAAGCAAHVPPRPEIAEDAALWRQMIFLYTVKYPQSEQTAPLHVVGDTSAAIPIAAALRSVGYEVIAVGATLAPDDARVTIEVAATDLVVERYVVMHLSEARRTLAARFSLDEKQQADRLLSVSWGSNDESGN